MRSGRFLTLLGILGVAAGMATGGCAKKEAAASAPAAEAKPAEGAPRARTITAYLGRLCGRIPSARTAAYFNRDPSSVAKDVLALDQAFRVSKSLRDRLDGLARRLIKPSSA